MIPAKLTMRNFMCYRDAVPPLDFNGIHLACLSGDNGNGKSAIIDAMTWALWGKARASSDDDLIYAAENEMEVEFEFRVGQQLYRVIRKRSRPKKKSGAGQSSLDLMIEGEGGFRTLTGNSIAQTEAKIRDVLHMDYDTFINSAYLRQGHADEFTRQAPAKRKEVLGNILGLEQYDEMEARARELMRRRENDKIQLENGIAEIDREIGMKAGYEAELAAAQERLAKAEAESKEKEAALNALRQQKESLEARKTQLDELAARMSAAERDIKRWEEQSAQQAARIKQYESIIGRREEIEEGHSHLAAMKKSCEEMDRTFRQAVSLEKQKDQLERKIEQQKNELLKEHAVAKSRIDELEKKSAKLPELKAQLGQAQAQIGKLTEVEAELAKKEEFIRETQQRVSYFEAEKSRQERESVELEEKLDMLTKHAEGHEEAKCPLCDNPLTPESRAHIEAKYQNDKKENILKLKATVVELNNKRVEAESARQEKERTQANLDREKTRARSLEELLKSKIKEIEEDSRNLDEMKDAVGGIEGRLARQEFALTEQELLGRTEVEISKLGYDTVKHEQSRQDMSRLERYEREKNSLDEASRQIESARESAARAEESLKERRSGLEADNRKKQEMTVELARLPKLRQEVVEGEAAYRELTSKRSRTQEEVGSIKARLERCVELDIKKKEKTAELGQTAGEESIYQELARAFGKAGIQALLIEMALPDIENEANDLLARMTDNRMHVKFETQKETKRGTVQETLDITIADELGTRDYEMFSGGEAFRINFAIRIALSRLLAKRAGAPLPTLIIDEGFGTQDAVALEKVKEAINSIQNDFEKILVITHMEELKDAFPTRIDVVKTAEGSTVRVRGE
jgi:DNA repair protein SbcC/Rad50